MPGPPLIHQAQPSAATIRRIRCYSRGYSLVESIHPIPHFLVHSERPKEAFPNQSKVHQKPEGQRKTLPISFGRSVNEQLIDWDGPSTDDVGLMRCMGNPLSGFPSTVVLGREELLCCRPACETN